MKCVPNVIGRIIIKDAYVFFFRREANFQRINFICDVNWITYYFSLF